jgi:O-antigen ligase
MRYTLVYPIKNRLTLATEALWGPARRIYVLGAATGLVAALIGVGIASGKWWIGLAAVFLPLLLLFPVESAIGSFVFLIPFDAVSVLGQGQRGRTLTWFAGAGTTAVLLGIGIVAHRLRGFSAPVLWWSSLVLWSLLTTAWALNPDNSLMMVPTVIAQLALYVIASCFRFNQKELKIAIVFAILGGCAAGIWTVYLFQQGQFYESGPETRGSLIINGRRANPDGLAESLLLPTSLAFGCFLADKRRLVKAGMLMVMGVTILGVLLTMSRGAFFALIAMFAVYLYRLRLGKRMLIPLMILGISLFFMPSAFFTRWQEARASGASGRTDIWHVGVKAFHHYGLIGAGLNNFPDAYTNYMSEAPQFRGYYRDPHNIYLAVAVEGGVIAVVLLGGAVFSQLRRSWQIKQGGPWNVVPATEAACISVLVYGMSGNVLWGKEFWLPWILISAAVGYAETTEQKGHPA